MLNPQEIEEQEFGRGSRLWDADPGVCCAAFQLGACEHTEAEDDDEGGADEATLADTLREALDAHAREWDEQIDVCTFSDAGLLTSDAGIVVTLADGEEFQITIVRSR